MFVVHTEASLGWGGQEIRVLTEARGFIERGHRVELLAPAEAKIHAAAPRYGVPAHALPIGRKRLAGVLALRRWLREHRPDVVNAHSSTDTWLTALACIGLPGAPPLLRTRHISAPIPRNFATRWLYQRATAHVVSTGEALREQLIRESGLDANRVTSVPTGIDTGRFRPGERAAARVRLRLPAEAPLFGIVATLRTWKGHEDLLAAFARLDDRAARLVVVGDGPRRAAIEQQIDALQLASRVHLPGNQDDVVPWLHAMDVFVLPSYANEGVPQALMQAMACGLPCITTPIGAIGEIARDEDTALLVAPRDVAALAAAMQRLLGDADLRRSLGARAAAFGSERFALSLMLDRMQQLFAAAIAHQ